MWNSSQSPYLICYHSPKDIIHSYDFDVELVDQEMTAMHGSKERHMGYIYRRRKSGLKEASTGAGAFFLRRRGIFSKSVCSHFMRMLQSNFLCNILMKQEQTRFANSVST